MIKRIKSPEEDERSLPRVSNDNRQFLDVDLKDDQAKNPEATREGQSYYQMAFGGKKQAQTPSEGKSDSEEDLESSSSKTFGTITEQPFEEDADSSERHSSMASSEAQAMLSPQEEPVASLDIDETPLIVANNTKRADSAMSGSSNNEKYYADFTDLKAKFLSICDRDKTSQRTNSAMEDNTAPMLHSGETLDLKGLVD